MKEITSRYLRDIGACQDACEQFRKELNGGHGLSVSRVFTRLKQINRLDWANWLIVRLMTHEQQIRYAIYAAEQVIELYEEKYPDDKRPMQAIEAARRYLDNPSQENKAAAADAARAAARAAYAAYAAAYAAYAAAYAAYAAAYAAYAAYAAARADGESHHLDAALKKMQLKIINYGLRLVGISAQKREAHP